MELTATIENWNIVRGTVVGEIYGDTKGRFKDGTPIRTSSIVEITPDKKVITRNSTYKLGKKAEANGL